MRRHRLVDSLGFAWAGIAHTVRGEPNMRTHLLIAVAVLVLAVWLGLTVLEWAVLALTIGSVLTCELLNTALEELVDLISSEQSDRARVVKDVAAGAVLVSAAVSVVVGLLLLGPPLWARLISGG